MQLENIFHMSSGTHGIVRYCLSSSSSCIDWIARELLDSIVDQFFPLLNSIEREVKALDDVVLSIKGPLRNRSQLKEAIPRVESIERPSEEAEKISDVVKVGINEKNNSSSPDGAPMWFVRPFFWGTFNIRRLVPSSIVWKSKQPSNSSRRKVVSSPPPPLARMASTRRLVTSLTRLLSPKSDVVSQIQKRLTGNGLVVSNVGLSEYDPTRDVIIYLSDIQGSSHHILLGLVVFSC